MTGPHLTPEREADPLIASTALLIRWVDWQRKHGGPVGLAKASDAQIQANQVALGLAVAEADKPHDGNER